jgi:hypothetical protein
MSAQVGLRMGAARYSGTVSRPERVVGDAIRPGATSHSRACLWCNEAVDQAGVAHYQSGTSLMLTSATVSALTGAGLPSRLVQLVRSLRSVR